LKKVRVFIDIWLENRLKVEERALLMALFRDMDKMNKVIIPAFKYLDKMAGITNSQLILKRLQKKKILKIMQIEENTYIHIRLKKGKTERVEENVFYIDGKWEKTLLLTFQLMKNPGKDFVWTDRGELSYLFNCTPGTITQKVKQLEDKGLITKHRFKDKYRIIPLV